MSVRGAIRGMARKAVFRYRDQRRRGYDVVVSDALRAVYFRIPKAANTSIRKALQADPAWRFREVRIDDADVRRRYADYFKFTFVRDPRSRVVSVYNNKICSVYRHKVDLLFWQYRGLRYRMPFEAFVRFLCSEEGRDRHADRHWMSQRHLLPIEDEAPGRLDRIGRFESLEEEWGGVCETLGIASPLRHYKRYDEVGLAVEEDEVTDQYYRGFYTESLMSMVEERYREDLEHFDY